VYHDIWDVLIREKLPYQREAEKYKDPFTVAAIKSGNIVGYVPRKNFYAVFVIFAFSCLVTESKCYSRDLKQGRVALYLASWFLVQKRNVSKARKI